MRPALLRPPHSLREIQPERFPLPVSHTRRPYTLTRSALFATIVVVFASGFAAAWLVRP